MKIKRSLIIILSILLLVILIVTIIYSWYNKSIMYDISYKVVKDDSKNIIIDYNSQTLELKKYPNQFTKALGFDFSEKIYLGNIKEEAQCIKLNFRDQCTLKIYYNDSESVIVVSERKGYPTKKHILTKIPGIDQQEGFYQEGFYIFINALYNDTGNEMFT